MINIVVLNYIVKSDFNEILATEHQLLPRVKLLQHRACHLVTRLKF